MSRESGLAGNTEIQAVRARARYITCSGSKAPAASMVPMDRVSGGSLLKRRGIPSPAERLDQGDAGVQAPALDGQCGALIGQRDGLRDDHGQVVGGAGTVLIQGDRQGFARRF